MSISKMQKYWIGTGEQSDFFKFFFVFLMPWIGVQYYRFRFSLADGHIGFGQWRWVVLSKQVLQAATHPGRTESIEWFTEDQAFSLSYDLAPPTTPSLSPISKLSLFLSLTSRHRSSLRERGGWGGAKPYDGEKAWSSMSPSILSEVDVFESYELWTDLHYNVTDFCVKWKFLEQILFNDIIFSSWAESLSAYTLLIVEFR